MQTLQNICLVCDASFDNWVDYQEHMALGHTNEPKIIPLVETPKEVEMQFMDTVAEEHKQEGIKVFSSGRTDLKRMTYPGPMPEMEKRLMVARGERRIGLQHFLSVIALVIPLLAGVKGYSFGDDTTCPGNSCHGTPGPQGPAGPQGPVGPTGATGLSGTNGRDGNTSAYWAGTNLGADIGLRLLDTRFVQLQAFDTYVFGSYPGQDIFANGYNSIVGVRAVIKLGSSYEERLIAQLRRDLATLKEELRVSKIFETSTAGTK